MNLTEEQHTICQAARDLAVRSSLQIQAFAGTGKTTTLAAIAESLPQRKVLYLDWCDDRVGEAAGYAAEALWKNICKPNSSAPVTHDCYLKLFFLQGWELAPRDWTVMLDEAQDADPVILGLLERHRGARIIVGDKYNNSTSGRARSTR
jgi:hypothetical protein